MQTVVETPTYLRTAGGLFSEEEQSAIVSAIASDPEAGEVMAGTGGYRKRRFARAGMGKRGGARVVYLFCGAGLPIFLITAYAKADRGNLSKAERNALAKLATSLSRDYGGRA